MSTVKRLISVPDLDLHEWEWPAFDTKLIQVFNQVQDVHRIMKYVDNTAGCIQAGGACGAWPLMLSKYFKKVYTFEPNALNFSCLVINCQEPNVVAHRMALGDEIRDIGLRLDGCEKTNAGAWYAHHDGDIPMVTIDSLNLKNVGLIQLDVEGMELEALKGARETIMESLPVISIEEKKLPHITRPAGMASAWLAAEFGYKVVDRMHRDVILKC